VNDDAQALLVERVRALLADQEAVRRSAAHTLES